MKLRILAVQIGVTALATLTLANLYAAWKLDRLQADAYRSQDRYTTGKRYRPNIQSSDETNRFGDLCAVAGFSQGKRCPFWAGERRHDFVTDRLGYKTLTALEQADVVIAGDSFLAATGGDRMKDQLGQQLQGLTGKRFYEAAHPGDPGDYLGRVAELDWIQPRGRAYVLLVYEGNDLARSVPGERLTPAVRPPQPHPLLAALEAAWNPVRAGLHGMGETLRNPPLPRLLELVAEAKSAHNDGAQPVGHGVATVAINGQQNGTLIEQREASRDPARRLPAVLRAGSLGWFAAKLLCVVVVPTKDSVYGSELSLGQRHPLLQKDLQGLEALGIRTVDLTPALRQAARARPGQPLFWRDDTHWNRAGIQVAAAAIQRDGRCLGWTNPPSHGG